MHSLRRTPSACFAAQTVPEDVVALVELAVAREEVLAGEEFVEDAAGAPDVHGLVVVRAAEQHLGRAVPERDHVVRVRAHGERVLAREPKVREFQDAVCTDEQVRGLQVAVEDAATVAVRESSEELLAVELGQRRAQAMRRGLLEEVLDVVLQALEHEHQSPVPRIQDHVLQPGTAIGIGDGEGSDRLGSELVGDERISTRGRRQREGGEEGKSRRGTRSDSASGTGGFSRTRRRSDDGGCGGHRLRAASWAADRPGPRPP